MEALTLPHIPSDHLASLRVLFDRSPGLSPFVHGLQRLRLVIDASFLLCDLIWLVKTRKEPSARTSFKEVLISGTVVAFAPTTLRQEVCDKIPSIAWRENISEEHLRAEWNSYLPYLHFIEADLQQCSKANGTAPVRDPNDLPYVYVYNATDASAVLSNDKDFITMGAPVVGLDVVIHLREYARSKTVEVSLMVFGTTIGAASMQGIMELLAALAKGISRLPDWAKILLVIGSLLAILHPGIRGAITEVRIRMYERLKPLLDTVGPVIIQLVQAWNLEREKALQSWNAAETQLRPRRRVTLKQYAVSACLEAGSPMTLQEIEAKARSYGYTTRAKNLMAYLSRILRQDSRFVSFRDGRWAIAQI